MPPKFHFRPMIGRPHMGVNQLLLFWVGGMFSRKRISQKCLFWELKFDFRATVVDKGTIVARKWNFSSQKKWRFREINNRMYSPGIAGHIVVKLQTFRRIDINQSTYLTSPAEIIFWWTYLTSKDSRLRAKMAAKSEIVNRRYTNVPVTKSVTFWTSGRVSSKWDCDLKMHWRRIRKVNLFLDESIRDQCPS